MTKTTDDDTKLDLSHLGWGLTRDQTDEADGATAAWGARAIFRGYKDDYMIDLLWDRQSSVGEKEDANALATWLNDEGLAKLRELLRTMSIETESDSVVSYGEGDYSIHASPKRSYGYLYITAIYKGKK